MPDIVITWTGWHANALRQALRMTNEEFAEHLNVAVRTVAYWRTRPEMVPRQGMQQILDVALDRAPELARAQFQRLLAEHGGAETRAAAMVAFRDPAGLTEWLTATGTSDEAIEGIDRAAAALAEAHTQTPARVLLADTRQLQARVQQVLTDGRLRHRQERELLRVNGDVLAHMSLLLSDLHAEQASRRLRQRRAAVPARGRGQRGDRVVRAGEERPLAPPVRPRRQPGQPGPRSAPPPRP